MEQISSSELYDFVERPTEYLRGRLGEIATQFRTVSYTEERARVLGREASHLMFELECRGEMKGLNPTPNDMPKRRKKK